MMKVFLLLLALLPAVCFGQWSVLAPDGVSPAFNFNVLDAGNGPVSNAGHNFVSQLGINIAPGGGNISSSFPAVAIQYELTYAAGGTAEQAEFHQLFNLPNGAQIRPYSAAVRYNADQFGMTLLSLEFDDLKFWNRANGVVYFEMYGQNLALGTGALISAPNNSQFVRARDSSGGNLLPLIYLDSSDRIKLGGAYGLTYPKGVFARFSNQSQTQDAGGFTLDTLNASFDTTAGALYNYGADFTANATRSAGNNNLTNVGIYATASGGQRNIAAELDGEVIVTSVKATSGVRPVCADIEGKLVLCP